MDTLLIVIWCAFATPFVVTGIALVDYHVREALAWRAIPATYREDQRSYMASQMPAMAYLDGKTSLVEAKRRAMMGR